LLKRPAKTLPPAYGTNACVCSLEIENFDATAETILDKGGIVALPRFAVPGTCWQGHFIDQEGNTFGIFEVDPNARYQMKSDTKTKATKSSVPEFIDAITDPARQAEAKTLAKLMKKATGEKPTMWGPAIVGFGSHHYKYESGREGDMPAVAFSPRKAASVLYLNRNFSGFEELLAKLGKHETGKGCLYIKKLADVDQKVLEEMVTKSFEAAH